MNFGGPSAAHDNTFITSELFATNLLCGFGNLQACIASRLGLNLAQRGCVLWALIFPAPCLTVTLHPPFPRRVENCCDSCMNSIWSFLQSNGQSNGHFLAKWIQRHWTVGTKTELSHWRWATWCRKTFPAWVAGAKCEFWCWHFPRYLSTVWTTVCLPVAKVALGQCHWTAIS